ncbi:MAG: hypothetical protein E7573_06240 [Ruminococcaceae bacterium]|nr:hypothetical protein [Oscillospiraceae bacterium]MBR3597243.1 hypothetical protein [Clostridia bacterium]
MKKHEVKTNIDFRINSPVLKTILIVILFLFLTFIVAYPIVVFSDVSSDIKTQTVVRRTVYNTIDTEAFVVRNETIITNSHSGTLVPELTNGSKVAIGDTVAQVYTDDGVAENAARLSELKAEINYYMTVKGTGAGTLQSDIDLYKSSVSDTLLAMASASEQDELSEIYELSRQMREIVTKKQIVTGNEIDVTDILTELQNEYESLKGRAVSSYSVTAEKSGYFVSSCDGYENSVDFENVKNMNPDAVNNAIATEQSPISAASVGKIITDFNWYLVCNTTLKDMGSIERGDNVTVSFMNSTVRDLTMRVIAVNQSEDNSSVTLVLGCNIMDEDIAALRKATIKIRVEAISGLALDRKALRTVGGQKGVYIKVGNIAEFRTVNIIYSDENIVIADNTEAKLDDHLELYDEIILEGTDLYDSKLLN